MSNRANENFSVIVKRLFIWYLIRNHIFDYFPLENVLNQ